MCTNVVMIGYKKGKTSNKGIQCVNCGLYHFIKLTGRNMQHFFYTLLYWLLTKTCNHNYKRSSWSNILHRTGSVPCQGLDHLQEVLSKSGPILGIGPSPIYSIGPGPKCHIGLAYNRQVCLQSSEFKLLSQPSFNPNPNLNYI